MHPKNLSRRAFVKAVTVAATGTAVGSVARISAQSSTDPVVEYVAKKWLTNLESEEEAATFLKAYQSLNFDQMELFNDVVSDLALRTIDEKEILPARVSISKNMRSDMNKLSQAKYGVPFNQVGGKEFSELIDVTWKSGYAKQVREQADQVQASSCSCFNYNFVTIPGGSGYFTNSSGRARAANPPNCGDCDLEVFFPANTTTVRWISGVGFTYYTYVNGQFLYRKPSSNSKMLIGYGAVNSVFVGSEWIAQIAYRMD